MNIIKTLFQKRDNSSYLEAIKRLSNVRKKLEKPRYREIYITEIHY